MARAQVSTISYFLAKTDPGTYSMEDLRREGKTVWEGVRNALARRALAAMRASDLVFIYHSMGQSAVVGLAKVTKPGNPDPEFQFLAPVEPPVTLKEIKESGLFDEWSLVRQSRLSTMPAPDSFAKWLIKKRPALKAAL